MPDRVVRLTSLPIEETSWAGLDIPVEIAFFICREDGRIAAFYPGPQGATESALRLGEWSELAAREPLLGELEPEVEALLVNKTRGEARAWVVPIDACYELTGLMRANWKGLAGGAQVWARIDDFFNRLAERARSPRPSAREG